jgi:N-acetylglucosaminyldiphosphoundecaprenol N-acetyl-beta-D-mannosaminyltransferase
LRRVEILGVEVDATTLAEAVEMICAAAEAVRAGGGRPLQVATVNPEQVMRARRAPSYRRALQGAGLRTADGAGLLLAARILGRPLPERVPGVELVLALARAAAARGLRLFLLGAAPGVADEAARRLVAAAPALQVAGTRAGDSGPQGDAENLAAIRQARADVVLVAFGVPAQEEWSARCLEASGAGAAIGVGGTFDYLSGRVRRAPAWMRRAGLEWLFRLARQPWRARRMAVLPVFAALVLAQRMRGGR